MTHWTQRYWPTPKAPSPKAQIIGLVKGRVSGITLSRHAYADVLRRIWPDLRDSTVQEAQELDCPVNVWAARPLSPLVLDQFQQRRFTGLNVWCLVLEVTTLPERTLEAAANADQIWVPTTFVRDVCAANGIPADKLHVVPYYLPPPTRPRVQPAAGQPWTALVSWDGCSNLNRKFVLGTIAAFQLAFPRSRRVALRLKTRDLRAEDRAAVLEAAAGDARIVLDERTLETADEIYDGAGCLLHLHRAEGYGRHIMEAMQRGLPVICTDYSGPMDWLTPDNHYGVGYRLTECTVAEYRYPQGGQWAEPDIEQAAAQIRRAYAAAGTRAELRMASAAFAAAMRASAPAASLEAMLAAFRACGKPIL
jgi:glycosyltransferase involved in cell wall biosynthesis